MAECAGPPMLQKVTKETDDDNGHVTHVLDNLTLTDEDGSAPGKVTVKRGSKGRQRPNFFLALRVTNQSLLRKLEASQKKLLDSWPQYGEHMTAPSRFHLTLAVLRFKKQEELDKYTLALKNLQPRIAQLAADLDRLNFRGLGNFDNGRVIFCRVQNPDGVLAFARNVESLLRADTGFRAELNKRLHLTFFSVPWEDFNKDTWEKSTVPFHIYNFRFGIQTFDNFCLCQMQTEDEDGFYHSPVAIYW